MGSSLPMEGLVLWWWHAFLVAILGLGFRVQGSNHGKGRAVRPEIVCARLSQLHTKVYSPWFVVLYIWMAMWFLVFCSLTFVFFLCCLICVYFLIEDLLFYRVALNCSLGSLYVVYSLARHNFLIGFQVLSSICYHLEN